jgi:CubicO group peptidase (beta-lactamase class C family)
MHDLLQSHTDAFGKVRYMKAIATRCVYLLVLAVGIAAGCSNPDSSDTVSVGAPRERPWAPPQLDDGWNVASAQSVGLDPAALDSMTAVLRLGEEFQNIHAVLIAKDDRLVYEQYFLGEDRRWRGTERETVSITFDRDTLHDTRSVGKSITSALVGIAVGSGAISSVDAPLVDFFPEHASLVTPEKKQITLQHALTMSAGLDWNELDVPYTDPANHEEEMARRADPAAFVLGRPLVAEPGSTWYYSGGLPTLMGLVVSRATGRPFGAYAREMLFEPLGITEVEWGGTLAWIDIPEFQWASAEPWAKVAYPAGSLWIRPRDLAKFGSLYLNEGRWNDRQVLPAAWVGESTRRHIAVKDAESEYGTHGYGYFWWHERFDTPDGELEVHAADGNGAQRIFVIPSMDMLVVILGGRYNDPDAFWMSERLLLDHIVPAVRRTDGPQR